MLPIVLLKLLLNPFENLLELLPSGSYTENPKMDQTSRKSAPPARQTPLDNWSTLVCKRALEARREKLRVEATDIHVIPPRRTPRGNGAPECWSLMQ